MIKSKVKQERAFVNGKGDIMQKESTRKREEKKDIEKQKLPLNFLIKLLLIKN